MSWGAFLGSLVNAGANLYTNSRNQKQARSNFDYQLSKQYKYAQRYALNGPSWAVQGLRAAGLNPILAVSNGVNTGANIPQASMTTPEMKNTLGSDLASLTEAFSAEKNAETNEINAEANIETADANTKTADANLIRAEADARLKDAQTLETIQRTKFEGQGKGYKNEIVNDISRGLSQASESLRDSPTHTSDVDYTQNRPYGVINREVEHNFNDRVQNDRKEIDWLSKETGVPRSKLSAMSLTNPSEYKRTLNNAIRKNVRSNKSNGYHFLTR